MRPDYLETAKRALEKYYANALGGFVAGSITRGEGTATSDIDIAVLFDDDFDNVHRNSVIEDGWPIEFFVHNQKAQDYFFDSDRKRGMCIMPTMVATGIVIPQERPELLRQKEKARAVIAAGPPLLTEDEIDFRRYHLTDLADDLRDAVEPSTRNAILALLYDYLGDFHLRAGGRWSGRGKSLLRCLRREDGDFALRFEDSFAAAFSGADVTSVLTLFESVLVPYGGPLWEGYTSPAPPDWRDFKGADE